jgi:alpha-mannosidase
VADKKTVHVISHTHWDREWYLPYEKHHVRLIRLMDTLLELLESDPEFRSFHLDGQTIVLEDYLQVRPERKDKLLRFVQEGRLHIGPWYILQDEFLTSSEANIRNLLIGLKDAGQYGAVSRIGYFPDSFGNMGQAPQILRQAGMDCAVFGRGVKATGFNNSVDETGGKFESPFSEMIWQSPDGSSVLGILFSNWYHNGMEIPVDEEAAKAYWETRIAKADKFASTPHLLFMNGCDHQPVQTNLSQALRLARRLSPEVEFVHSNFDDYIRAVREQLPEKLAVVTGELRSQRTDGWTTLVNTASARVYIKQANQLGQALLEKVAEPLAAFASSLGADYPHHLFTYAWKTLMQNHPHDSICGCSVDEVHREMMTRFAKSRHVAETIIDDSACTIAEQVNTSAFADAGGNAVPFVVFNTTGWARTGVVSVELDVARVRFDGRSPADAYREMQELSVGKGELIDHAGRAVACEVEDLGAHFCYELPDDAFRQRYMARRIRLTFEAVDVPALGHAAYAWRRPTREADSRRAASTSPLHVGERTMENARLKVEFAANGSFVLTDKTTGRSFRDLCVYEEVGDIGNEYIFKQPEGDQALTTESLAAEIELVEHTEAHAVFKVTHRWEIPAGTNEAHDEDIRQMVSFRRGQRKGQRSAATVPLVLSTFVTLEAHGQGVKVRTAFDNQAKNHRLRVLLPTDVAAATHFADSIFEVAERDNVPAPEWSNPSYCHHQQAFVDVGSEAGGMTVANLGLCEYEVLQDGRNTIAVTLLRAVGELGDWGVFPTPEAQCLGEQAAEFEIIPHSGDGISSGAYTHAYQFQVPWTVRQTGVHGGSLPPAHTWLAWNAPSLALSAVKIAEETGDLIVRWFNMARTEEHLTAAPASFRGEVYRSNVIEERKDPLAPDAKGTPQITAGPAEIVTLAFSGE